MHELSAAAGIAPPRHRQCGVTLVELLVAMAIFGILLAVGIPSTTGWLMANRARSAAEFYADGFSLARRQAITHNSYSRISLSPNVHTGQMDWQVDICFPTPDAGCSDVQGGWSTVAAPAAADPEGASGYRSVHRAADTLPSAEVLVPSRSPDGASQVYYTPLGWVDTVVGNRLARLRLDPVQALAGDVPPVAIVVTLAGMATKCRPDLPANDSRGCPP